MLGQIYVATYITTSYIVNTVEIILSLWKLFLVKILNLNEKISRLICKEDPQEIAINNFFIIWTDKFKLL